MKNGRRTADRWAFVGAMGVVAALFGWRIYQFWEYTVDDAYITLRYARNVVEGYGLVYNPGGPRVEGYSNPLLLLFQCVVLFLNGEGMLWTKILGALAGFATLAACLLIALDLLRWAGEEATRVSLIVSVAGVFYVADNAPLSTGSVSGLETSLFAALLTWGTWGFLRVLQGEGRRAGVAVAGLCLGLATWTRPEGIAWAGGVAGLVVLMRALRRESVRAALVDCGWLSRDFVWPFSEISSQTPTTPRWAGKPDRVFPAACAMFWRGRFWNWAGSCSCLRPSACSFSRWGDAARRWSHCWPWSASSEWLPMKEATGFPTGGWWRRSLA